jgi:hypothetical protein
MIINSFPITNFAAALENESFEDVEENETKEAKKPKFDKKKFIIAAIATVLVLGGAAVFGIYRYDKGKWLFTKDSKPTTPTPTTPQVPAPPSSSSNIIFPEPIGPIFRYKEAPLSPQERAKILDNISNVPVQTIRCHIRESLSLQKRDPNSKFIYFTVGKQIPISENLEIQKIAYVRKDLENNPELADVDLKDKNKVIEVLIKNPKQIETLNIRVDAVNSDSEAPLDKFSVSMPAKSWLEILKSINTVESIQ